MTLARSAAVVVLLLACATTLFAQGSAAKSAKKTDAGLQATLEKLEKQGWDAYKNRDAKAYADLCTPEYTSVLADGKGNRDLKATLAGMSDVTINSYRMDDVKLVTLGPDAALLNYNAAANLTFADGKPRDLKLAITSAYVKRGGQWKAVRYHESEVK